MWQITGEPHAVEPGSFDPARFRFTLRRGDTERRVTVELTGTLMHCAPETLPSPLDRAVETSGAVVLERYLEQDNPPECLLVHSAGWTTDPDS